MSDKPCAYCGRHARVPAHAPFCSDGCRSRDLLQWLGEGYRVPAGPHIDGESGLDNGADAG
jgi:endogenous inhibitor of DNA gyrase (YacG/DUF329 family)